METTCRTLKFGYLLQLQKGWVLKNSRGKGDICRSQILQKWGVKQKYLVKLQERKGDFIPVNVNHKVKLKFVAVSFVQRGGLGPR